MKHNSLSFGTGFIEALFFFGACCKNLSIFVKVCKCIKLAPRKTTPFMKSVPGSVVEFERLIPLLTSPSAAAGRDFVFEVVAPSIPGYGFSSAPAKVREQKAK